MSTADPTNWPNLPESFFIFLLVDNYKEKIVTLNAGFFFLFNSF
jgi:hypothetical protein